MTRAMAFMVALYLLAGLLNLGDPCLKKIFDRTRQNNHNQRRDRYLVHIWNENVTFGRGELEA